MRPPAASGPHAAEAGAAGPMRELPPFRDGKLRRRSAGLRHRHSEWTVEVATEMRAATAAVPSQTQQLAEVSGLRWVGETPPAIAIAECEKAEGARAEGGERKRKREGCGL